MLGWIARGARYGDRAVALAREFNDIYVLGFSCSYRGIGLYQAAHYEEGLERLTEAIGHFEKAGDRWELHLAQFHKACCHFGLGQLPEAVDEVREVFASSARYGDSRTLCSSWLWARSTGGGLPFESVQSCYPNRPDDIMSTVHGLLAEGQWHIHHDRFEKAIQVLERAAKMVRTSGCVNGHTILVMPVLARALRLRADAVEQEDPSLARNLRRRSQWLAKWASRITVLFPAAYPVSLREYALILDAQGQSKRALRIAEKSRAVAETQAARYEQAKSAARPGPDRPAPGVASGRQPGPGGSGRSRGIETMKFVLNPKVVSLVLLAIVGYLAYLPGPSATELERLKSAFNFEVIRLQDGDGPFKSEGSHLFLSTNLHHVENFLVSFIPTGATFTDLDSNGLFDEFCTADPFSSRVRIFPAPTRQEPFEPFEVPMPEGFDRETARPTGCLSCDFDQDGTNDLLVHFWGRSPVLVFNADTDGRLEPGDFEAAEFVSPPQVWYTHSASTGDVDGDGPA